MGTMTNMRKIHLFGGMLSLTVVLAAFQNCSKASFEGKTASSSVSSSTDFTPVDPDAPPPANSCFEITCVSSANAANTFEDRTDMNGVIWKIAPTKGSTWVVQLNQSGIKESHNCWADQQVAAGDRPDERDVPLCKAYAGMARIPGGTFNGGYAKNFMICSRDACNSARSQVVHGDDNSNHWLRAKKNSNGSAHLQVRVAGWQMYSPSTFTVEYDIPSDQCASRTYNYIETATSRAQAWTYKACYSGQVLTVGFGRFSSVLDLRALP